MTSRAPFMYWWRSIGLAGAKTWGTLKVGRKRLKMSQHQFDMGKRYILQTSLYFAAASSFSQLKLQQPGDSCGSRGHTGCFCSHWEGASPQYLYTSEKTTPKLRRPPIGELLDVQPLPLVRLPGAALHLLLSFSTQRNFTVNADRPHGSQSGGNEEVIRSISGQISFYNIIRKCP